MGAKCNHKEATTVTVRRPIQTSWDQSGRIGNIPQLFVRKGFLSHNRQLRRCGDPDSTSFLLHTCEGKSHGIGNPLVPILNLLK